ncbi:hypothetical protein WKK05_40155 (plasmid) [Nostoc sp. UHCC 0302]|uniref:hypothetical protein n=1 Tax=Nostoc sp. UHCC 0302 TaxID=3134896 RepID=UPI00311C8B36
MSQCVGRVPRLEATGEPEGLNQVEIELSVLSRQCLGRRIPDTETLTSEIAAWESQRNQQQTSVHWSFKTKDARQKMQRLYPNLT